MRNLDNFVDTLSAILGKNIISIIAFGSKAQVLDAKNNLNLMIVTNTLNADDLYEISKPVQKWVKCKNPIPIIMNIEEWQSSFDVYAIEYSDMKNNYRIVYGEDIVKDIYIEKHDLRLECESELKNLLLKYKNNFLMNINSDRMMKKTLSQVTKTLLVIFRSILRLHDAEVPYRAIDIIEYVSNYINFNKEVMLKIAKVKYENDSFKKDELFSIEAKLLEDIQSILMQVDAMQF